MPAVPDRLLLVATSPRLPAGLLSFPAWEALRAGPVFTAAESAQADAVRAAGIEVTLLDPANPAAFRAAAASAGVAVWLAGADGDPRFTRELGDLVAREGGAEVEVVFGSWDPPGARLLDAVAVMDRLRSPGGCPWDAEQTHESLARYLVEEAYETVDAIENADREHLREELGDVLLQILFHSRLAEEDGDEPWSVDDVAAGLVDKLVRRHPHVFAGREVEGAAEVEANWDEIKAAEKGRASVTDGVPLGQPALALAAALERKAARLGVPPDLVPSGEGLGERLFGLVAAARSAGEDPEVALRVVARRYRDAVAAVEHAVRAEGRDPADVEPEEWRARWLAEAER